MLLAIAFEIVGAVGLQGRSLVFIATTTQIIEPTSTSSTFFVENITENFLLFFIF